MKLYEEYVSQHEGWYELADQMLHDILAELERLCKNIDTVTMTTLEMEERIAKMEIYKADKMAIKDRLAKLEEAGKS